MKRYLPLGVALVLFAILPGFAHAQTTPPTPVQTVVVNWTAPTKNTDGTTIAGPVSYNVYRWATGAAGVTKIATAQSTLSFTDTSPPPSPCYLVSAIVLSSESLPASVCTGPTPGIPGSVTVTISLKFN